MITTLLRPYFVHRARKTNSYPILDTQRDQLAWLLHKGTATKIGTKYDFWSLNSYAKFAKAVPVSQYQDIRPYVMRMIEGEKDVLWKGRTTHFAQSSGTSDGKSKYIPVTNDSFHRNHYKGASDVVAHYLNLYPQSRIFDGKAFILGGSFANELTLPKGVVVGDLSANLIDNINPLANAVRVPSKQVALMEDWNKKLPALVDAAVKENITNISGVPSWFLTVLREVIKKAGATTIHDVWRNLEVFFHGGISFDPYRDQYRAITDPAKMHYLESYNASEGFFAVQNAVDDRGMLMLLDNGIFFEFIPLDQIDDPFPEALPAWKVKEGDIYALVITACNGLWRYMIGDTVRIESASPLKITIAGRTRHYINAFGEELMVYNAEEALSKTCRELGCSILNFTAAPVFTTDHSRGRHEWLIEFDRQPADIDRFARLLDSNLQQENSDYQAKRAGNIFLDPLSVVIARQGLFNDWLKSTGKLGGQRKVPRLANDRHIITPLLQLNSKTV